MHNGVIMHACRFCLGKGVMMTYLVTLALIILVLCWNNDLGNIRDSTSTFVWTVQHVFDTTPSAKTTVISWENIDSVLAGAADAQRELIFTTFSRQYKDDENELAYGMAAWNLNFVGHLKRSNVSNFLIIGTSELACEMTRRRGVTCWEDGLGWELGTRFYRGRPVGLKWFYLQQIVERGYHPIFLDNDVVALQNPFHHWNRSIDIQGLYDMNFGRWPKHVSDFNSSSQVVCPLVTMGDYYTNWPCMSTGVIFVRATPASHAVISAMVDHLSLEPEFWEQAMWQTEVLPFLSREERRRRFIPHPPRRSLSQILPAVPSSLHPQNLPPGRFRQRGPRLRFQLLPLEKFHNVNTLLSRRRLNLTVDTVLLHCGYIHGFDKIVALHSLNLWLLSDDSDMYKHRQLKQ